MIYDCKKLILLIILLCKITFLCTKQIYKFYARDFNTCICVYIDMLYVYIIYFIVTYKRNYYPNDKTIFKTVFILSSMLLWVLKIIQTQQCGNDIKSEKMVRRFRRTCSRTENKKTLGLLAREDSRVK